jgi:Major Facilitator Superfamily
MTDARSSARSGAAASPATFRSVFAVGEFRVLFAGLSLFALGFELEILGLSVLVYARTGSTVWAAAAFSAGFLPQAAGGAFLTSLADRLPPRLVITAGLVTRAGPGLAIGLLPGLPVLVMLAIVALAAVIMPVFLAGFSGLLPDVLDGDRYVLGRSVFTITASATQVLGLGIGGAILAALPARWLVLSAGCALIAAAVVARFGLRARPSRARHAKARGGLREVVRATITGNAELLRIPAVRGLLLAQWFPAWCCTGAEALVVPYAEALGQPASTAGPLLAAVPCGMLVGDVVVGRFCRPAARPRLAFPLALLVGVPLLALGLRPPLLLAAAALIAAGVGCAYPLGLQQAFLDSVPARIRGQGFGLNTTGLMGGQGLLPSAFGGIAAVVGPAAAIAVAGGVCVLAVAGLRRLLLRPGGRDRGVVFEVHRPRGEQDAGVAAHDSPGARG